MNLCFKKTLAGSAVFTLSLLALMLPAVASADQIVNGNFSAGYTGFTSGYTQVATNHTVFTAPGDYALVTNPAVAFTNGYPSYTDHTGDAAGLMMFVDGAAPGVNVWSELIAVAPSSSYTFSAWVASGNVNNAADLGLFINGVQVGASFGAPTTAGEWINWTQAVNTSASQSQVTISIQDLNPTPYVAGDDFSLDDLSLNGPTPGSNPEPSSLSLMALAAATIILCLFQPLSRWTSRR